MRPIEELEGTWMNVDCPREQYIIHGLRITRTDARGTRNFTIHWDHCRQRWQWGTHGRLSLQWLGDDAIAWVPDSAWDADHSRVWRWQRCTQPQAQPGELAPSSYRPWRRSHGQHAEEPYSGRPWRTERAEESDDWRSPSSHHRDSHHHGHHHGHHRSHHRSHHRDHHSSYGGSHHRDRHSSQVLHRSDHGGRRGSHGAMGDLQANQVLPCGLTPVEVYSLLSREILPEDYELLLRLDEAVVKPTVSVDSFKCLSTVACEHFMGGKCSVCLCAFEEQDSVAALPCQHRFHRACLLRWLSECRQTCPLCGAEAPAS